ncbi:MAG: hypothetical protein J7M38_05215 [Armatimonadetes bacterium]|nr:hypothetical protein [Armatimonadota bacterium]
MVRDRRYGRVLLIALGAAAVVATLVSVGLIFAQPDAPPEAEAGGPPGGPEEMGMMGMGGPGPAAGIPLQWSETPVEEELQKTYDEYLAETGQERALIPDVYLYDDEGNPKKYSFNQWAQLQRIYAGRAEVTTAAAMGRPGNALATRVAEEMAVKEAEIATVRRLYEQGLDNFFFKVAFPQIDSAQIRPGASSITMDVGVYMGVKPGVAQRYPSLVYRALKKYDNYGVDRQIFRIVDYEGGMWNPKQIWLYNGAVSEWNRLWGANEISLTLYDVDGDRIVTGRQPAQLNGGICAKLVYPDELNYSPMHETLIPPRDYTFEGGKLNLDYKKGWYYNFSFSIPIAQLVGLDRAEVVLIGADGQEGSRGETQAPAITETRAQSAPSGASVSNAGEESRGEVQSGVEDAKSTIRTMTPMMGQQIPPGFY